MEAKILLYDIECTGSLGWSYGLFQSNMHHVEVYPIILSFSYGWYDSRSITHHQVKIKFQDLFNGKALKEEKRIMVILRDLFDKADMVMGHNSNGFDNKMAMAAFIKHRISPPSPFKNLDTLVMSKAGRFASHSLQNLCNVLGIKGKTDVKHGSIWRDFVDGKRLARKQMEEYNDQDVDILYDVYKLLRPYARVHPNMNMYNDKPFSCTRCGGTRLQSRGTKKTDVATYRNYYCLNKECGAWSRDRLADKDFERPELV